MKLIAAVFVGFLTARFVWVSLRPTLASPSLIRSNYRGRTVIAEVMLMSPAIQKVIMERADASVVRRISREEGMETMLDDGLHKAVKGVTTLEEVARVV